MAADKNELRARFKKIRFEMEESERVVNSRRICEKLKKAIEWSEVSSLHYFEAMKELVEVDVSDLVTYLEDTYKGMHLYVPRKIAGQWETVALRGGDVKDFDVVIVPMLGFDKNLQRIGFGGGFYDRFLANQITAKKIGVCFESGRVNKVSVESHDVALDIVVTEKQIYKK